MNKARTVLLIVCVTLAAVGCGRPQATSSFMASQEHENLKASLAGLESVLEKHSPFIHDKLAAPATEEDISELRQGLGGVEVQCLELWYRWHIESDYLRTLKSR